MTLTRWKMLAGVLGVSLGGLAVAAQCPKTDASKGGKSEPIVALAPPVAEKSKSSEPAPPAVLPDLPSLPALPEVPTKAPDALPPVKLPESSSSPIIPASGTETKPDTKPATPPAPPALPGATGLPSTPELPKPSLPGTPPAPPVGDKNLPSLPPELPSIGKPEVVPPPSKTTPSLPPELPPMKVTPAAPGGTLPPPLPGSNATPPPPVGGFEVPAIDPLATQVKPIAATGGGSAPVQAVAQIATKFRIVLRVGEGEPTFEVRCGDDLVLKVACEKVDIKSPEKGNGPSVVKATGKVRFAGFGAEGVCEELSFLAGTGEVRMSGAVKVQVKDKLGRVESELASDSINYKLDPAQHSVVKP